MVNKSKQEKIAIEVIKTLYKRFLLFPSDASNNRNAPFHEAFLKAFKDKLNNKFQDIPYFISLASWLHGLNTTLGQSFFENVAHILSDGEKRDFKQANNNLPNIYSDQIQSITDIIADLKNGTHAPSLSRETAILEKANGKGELKEGTQFTVDVFCEDDSEVTAVELKTVKPNAGEMRVEKQKILEGKVSLMRSFPTKTIRYYIGFPFDPNVNRKINSATYYDKDFFLSSIVGGKKYFDPDEILLSKELWDFLSNEPNTMDLILEIINNIAT
ncbi:MAG: TdeIII family type II restriction endonuclease, partial [Bacteroidales bacterium]|nr:TdeIII family type II restriction endonuclease [Bacteroidales bacterium]